MKFETKIFDEPHLEFGDKHHHPDPRLGLFEAGPLQTPLGDVIKIAVIGSSKTVEDAKEFLGSCCRVCGKGEKHPNMHPDFPAWEIEIRSVANSRFADGATVAIAQSKIDKIRKEPHHGKAVEMAVDEIVQQLQTLDESSHRPHVAIVALPVELDRARVERESRFQGDDRER